MLFVLFQLERDRYALEAAQVAEVTPLVHLKEIPRAIPGVAGVFNYRGTPVPVIDLSAIALGRPAPARLGTRVILVHYPSKTGERRLLGLIAEKATETMRRNPTDFVAPGISDDQTPYLGPVATDARGVIQWIKVSQLLPAAVQDLLFKEMVALS